MDQSAVFDRPGEYTYLYTLREVMEMVGRAVSVGPR